MKSNDVPTAKLGTTVRALVHEHGDPVPQLQESFAADAGLYWAERK